MKARALFPILLALFFAGAAAPARAADALLAPPEPPAAQAPEVTTAPLSPSRISKHHVRVGEEFVLAVPLPEGEAVAGEARVAKVPEGFSLKGVRVVRGGAEGESYRIELTLAPFDLKATEVPQLEISYRNRSAKEVALRSEAQPLAIDRVTGEETKEIEDIRGPLAVALSWWRYLLYALLLAAAASVLLRYARRRGRARAAGEFPAAPRRPAHELALEALAALERLDLPGRGEVKEHCSRLSEILRTYLEGRFQFLALEQTTDEIRLGLDAADLGAAGGALRAEALALLDGWDLVKFAKMPLSPERSREQLAQARAWIEATRPPPPAVGPPAAPPAEAAGAVPMEAAAP